MDRLNHLVAQARNGDLDAFAGVVKATQTMAFALAVSVLRDTGAAQDAVQDAYLRAFRRFGDLDEPAAFLVWFRRIVITAALGDIDLPEVVDWKAAEQSIGRDAL